MLSIMFSTVFPLSSSEILTQTRATVSLRRQNNAWCCFMQTSHYGVLMDNITIVTCFLWVYQVFCVSSQFQNGCSQKLPFGFHGSCEHGPRSLYFGRSIKKTIYIYRMQTILNLILVLPGMGWLGLLPHLLIEHNYNFLSVEWSLFWSCVVYTCM